MTKKSWYRHDGGEFQGYVNEGELVQTDVNFIFSSKTEKTC